MVYQTPSTPQQTRDGNRKKRGDYNFSTENDIQGIVTLEILSATDLPKLKNSTSPPPTLIPTNLTDIYFLFFVYSDAHRLALRLFHMRAYESAFKVQLTVLNWAKLLSNDNAGVMVADLMPDAPQRDEKTM